MGKKREIKKPQPSEWKLSEGMEFLRKRASAAPQPKQNAHLLYYGATIAGSRSLFSSTNYKPNYFTNEKQIF